MIVPTAAKNVPWAQKSQSLAQPLGKEAVIVPTAAENVPWAQKSRSLAQSPEKEAVIVPTAAENVPWALKCQSLAQPPEKEAIICRQPGEPERRTAGTETGAIQVVDFSEYVSETGRILCGRAYLPRAH